MKRFASTITSKGQVTIPKEVREYLSLKRGDKISFVIEPSGAVVVRAARYPNLDSLAGAAGTLDTPLEFEEMLKIAREDALEEKFTTR